MGLQRIRITKGSVSQNITIIAWERMNKDVKDHGWSRSDGTLPAPSIIPVEILDFKKKKIEELRATGNSLRFEKKDGAEKPVIIPEVKSDEITGNPLPKEGDEFTSLETKELAKKLAPKMVEALRPVKKVIRKKTKKSVKK